MVGILVSVRINISGRLSANQRALYAHANHVLTEHNCDRNKSISRRPAPMLMSRPSSLAHKLLVLMLMLMLASEVSTGLFSEPKGALISQILSLPPAIRGNNGIILP